VTRIRRPSLHNRELEEERECGYVGASTQCSGPRALLWLRFPLNPLPETPSPLFTPAVPTPALASAAPDATRLTSMRLRSDGHLHGSDAAKLA
jgi:hypothetical protein